MIYTVNGSITKEEMNQISVENNDAMLIKPNLLLVSSLREVVFLVAISQDIDIISLAGKYI